MRIVLYSEKSVSQCMTALTERLQAKGRLSFDGWVEKKGSFSLGVTTQVLGRFPRTTYFTGKAERLGGCTMISGTVAAGASMRGLMLIVGGLALAGGALMFTGNTLVGMAMIPVAGILYVPLRGDYENSEILIGELQKTLKAKFTPPVKQAAPKASPLKAPTKAAAKAASRTVGKSAPKTPAKARTATTRPAPKPAPKSAPMFKLDE